MDHYSYRKDSRFVFHLCFWTITELGLDVKCLKIGDDANSLGSCWFSFNLILIRI